LPASLEDARAVFGDRQAALANDLTKLYEEVMRGRLSDLAAHVADKGARGEYILVIAGADEP
jgi:16S rRNA (cytidine1402-2'-O)-methyltransferase